MGVVQGTMTNQPEVVKYHQLDEIFPNQEEQRIVGSLISARCIVKDGDGYRVERVRSEVERYKGRLVVHLDVTAQTGLSPNRVSEALLDAEKVGGMIDNISHKPKKRLYCLREGISLDELEAYVARYSERIEGLKGEAVPLGTIREEVGIPLARFCRILDAGLRDKYLTTIGKRGTGGRGGARYRLKPGKTREEFVAELGVLKDSYFPNELAAALGLPAPKISAFMTPELEEQYLEVIVFGDGKRMWRVRSGKDIKDLSQALVEREASFTTTREVTSEGKKVRRLMFLQSRYQGDTEYAAKIELKLRAYPHVDPERRRAAEHQALDEIAALLYQNMPSSRRDDLVKELQREYKVTLSFSQESERKEQPATALEGEYFTHHHISSLLGLHTFQAKAVLFTLFKEGIITAVGGSQRIPRYKLKEGISVEEFVKRALEEYEDKDTKKVLNTTNEGNGTNRVLFLKARYPADKLYHAKIDLYLRGYSSALLLQGWKGMQALEHQMLDSGLKVMFSYLPLETAERIVKSVTANFGVDLTRTVQDYIGIHLHDPVDYLLEADTPALKDRSGSGSGERTKIPARKERPAIQKEASGKRSGKESGRERSPKKARTVGVSRSTAKISARALVSTPSTVKKTPPVPEAASQPSPAPLRGNAAWLALGGDDDDDDDDDDPVNDLDWEDDEEDD